MKRTACKLGQCGLMVALFLLSGCASSSLKQQVAGYGKTSTIPATVYIGTVADPVACDDEAIYLQEYWRAARGFIAVDLVPVEQLEAEQDADLVVQGTIRREQVVEKKLGFGRFLSVITLGTAYVLGMPTRSASFELVYEFQVSAPATGKSSRMTFRDQRKARWGAYGVPPAFAAKPDVYLPGFRELHEQIRNEGLLHE